MFGKVSEFSRRIFDVAEENPSRVKNPIRGLKETPLVTLMEAIQPLAGHIGDIEDFAYCALQSAQKMDWRPEGMSVDGAAAINLYTRAWDSPEKSFYFQLNKYLRDENRGKLKPFFPILKLLLTAFHQLPPVHGNAWRGIKIDAKMGKHLTGLYKKGEIIPWWGFGSCTTEMETLENDMFLGKTGNRILFNISVKSGRMISDYSHFKNEAEVLLPTGIFFRVRGILQTGQGLTVVQLEETDAPFKSMDFSVPAKTPVSRSQNVGASDKLADAMENRKFDKALKCLQKPESLDVGKVCDSLSNLSIDPRETAPEKLSSFVLELMKLFPSKPDMHRQCLRILAQTGFGSDVAWKNGLDTVLPVMRGNTTDSRLQVEALRALTKIHDEFGYVDEDGINPLVTIVLVVMQTHLKNVDLQILGFTLLHILLPFQWPGIWSVTGGVDVMLAAMREHNKHEQIVTKAIKTLRRVNYTDKEKRFIEMGGLDLTITVLRLYPDRRRIQEDGCRILGQISSSSEESCIEVGTKGGLEIALSAAKTFPDSLLMIHVQAHMCRSSTNRKAFKKSGGIELVLTTMEGNPTDANLQLLGCELLSILCTKGWRKQSSPSDYKFNTSNSCNDDMAIAVIQKGGVVTIFNAIKAHKTFEFVLIPAVHALVMLSKVPAGRDIMVKQEVGTLIKYVLEDLARDDFWWSCLLHDADILVSNLRKR